MPAIPVGAQETPADDFLTFDSVIERAVSASGAVSLLRDTLSDQLTETGLRRYFQGIGVSISGAVGGNPADPFFGSGDAALSANFTLLPQLSVGGNLSAPYTDAGVQPLEASFGLTVMPLADAMERPRDLLEIEHTRLQLDSAVRAASYTAVSRLMNAVIAERQNGLDEAEYSVAEKVLAAVRTLYGKEQATEAAYTAAKTALRSRDHDRRLSRLESEKTLEHLAQAVAVPEGRFRIPPLDQLGLNGIAEQAAAFLDAPDIDLLAERSAGVRLASLDVKEAEIDLSAARVFSPSLSITAGAVLPDSGYSAGVQFAFSVSDFDRGARDDAQRNLSSRAVAYENTRSMARFDVRRAVLELEIALVEMTAAEEALEESRLDLAETRYFTEQGEATELELAQAELAVQIAEHGVAGAEVEVVGRWFAIELSQY